MSLSQLNAGAITLAIKMILEHIKEEVNHGSPFNMTVKIPRLADETQKEPIKFEVEYTLTPNPIMKETSDLTAYISNFEYMTSNDDYIIRYSIFIRQAILNNGKDNDANDITVTLLEALPNNHLCSIDQIEKDKIERDLFGIVSDIWQRLSEIR